METSRSSEWAAAPLFNPKDLLESCMGDPDLVKDIVATVLDDAPKNFALLKSSLESGDLETARRAAHSVKSVARQLGGSRLALIMQDQELALREGRHPDPQTQEAALPAWEGFRAGLLQTSGLTG